MSDKAQQEQQSQAQSDEFDALCKLDLYVILGITDTDQPTDSQLKQAYKRQSLRLHPDKNRDDPKAADKFDQMSRAYALLRDGDKRAVYMARRKADMVRKRKRDAEQAEVRDMRDALERRESAHRASYGPGGGTGGAGGDREYQIKQARQQTEDALREALSSSNNSGSGSGSNNKTSSGRGGDATTITQRQWQRRLRQRQTHKLPLAKREENILSRLSAMP